MASETFIAQELFGSLWDLTLIGSLRNSSVVQFPFDPQIYQFTVEHKRLWQQILKDIREYCHFSPQVMKRAISQGPWFETSLNSNNYSLDRLNGELLLACGSKTYEQINFNNNSLLRRKLEFAMELQMIKVFDSLLQGRYCFRPKLDPENKLLTQIIKKIYGLVGETEFLSGGGAVDIVKKVYNQWYIQIYKKDILDGVIENEYQEWLNRTVINHFK
ncbi:hypothetical protein [Gimesia chilikensis]|uniref:hypothetical protein n=1 Tax=Gimesia chilikensis TaxID=2605989 RepID=UPI00118A69FA|nr:hypothetical protein [Gimesia chilikensis]QDT86448.1 hypothetical protein MalM14_41240 [Gimesia chilikensis]